MAEQGAKPNVSKARRRALDPMRSLFTPLLPDDYLELINPLWSTQELRGRVERIHREAGDAVTIVIRLGGVEGDFVLPDPLPDSILFITAGSGITPVMSMLRHLDRQGELDDVV